MNFHCLQNYRKIVRPKVKFFEPVPQLGLLPTGTSPNRHFPQPSLFDFFCAIQNLSPPTACFWTGTGTPNFGRNPPKVLKVRVSWDFQSGLCARFENFASSNIWPHRTFNLVLASAHLYLIQCSNWFHQNRGREINETLYLSADIKCFFEIFQN